MNIVATILYGMSLTGFVIAGAIMVWYLAQAERSDGSRLYSTTKIYHEKPFIVLVYCGVAAIVFASLGGICSWVAS